MNYEKYKRALRRFNDIKALAPSNQRDLLLEIVGKGVEKLLDEILFVKRKDLYNLLGWIDEVKTLLDGMGLLAYNEDWDDTMSDADWETAIAYTFQFEWDCDVEDIVAKIRKSTEILETIK